MTQEPNDAKFKLAVARMLPDKISIVEVQSDKTEPSAYWFRWKTCQSSPMVVRETEWLAIVSLVESALNDEEKAQYSELLFEQDDFAFSYIFATFNQRARAIVELRKAKPC